MDWFVLLSLPSIIITPLAGALFLLFIPSYEPLLRRRVALFFVAIAGLIHARNSVFLMNGKPVTLDLTAFQPSAIKGTFTFQLDAISFVSLSYIIVAMFLLIYCDLSKNLRANFQFNSKVLFVLALSCLGILSRNFGFFILVQYVVVLTLFFVNLEEGGPHRSSSTLVSAIFFTVVDLSAFFVWTYERELSTLIQPGILPSVILFPLATRILIPFLAPWSRRFFANSTVETGILYLGTSFILSVAGLARINLASPFWFKFSLVAAFFGALLSISARSFMQFLIGISSVGGSIVLAMLSSSPKEVSQINVLIYASSLSLLVAFGLFIQRAMLEEDDPSVLRALQPLWLMICLLIIGLMFIMAGKNILMLAILLLVGLAFVFRLGEPFEVRPTPASSKIPSKTSIIVNAWLGFSLVAATCLFFILLTTQAVTTQ